ncbi:sugar ABC transporter ATP-binding protein [Acidiferrimicrobium sp. IK]|uniref:sugar ABC transporter ATP-binding protein n=1 Tax=Acidiferrimicrobium sp. IK TaxID=2871700 RepID=UPI0021CAFB20|nr:sugar ABC transporter ATP-binding protein [Acidiferrimicrobium sp. IK]MCU4186752.1 sugar ABC transporter ATP-binding protein [Acidiferrimicrobium sp. IK]
MADVLLSIRDLSKSFNGVRVLSDVALDVQAGEIHGLVGQNGSGKSTLIKCLSGYHAPDPHWQLRVDGAVVTRGLHPGEPARLGISFVHQDLGVIGEMTVLENLLFHRLGENRRPYIAWRRERREASALLESFDLDLDPRVKLGSLRPVEQAQVAIIRSLMQLREGSPGGGQRRGVLVLDEATTFLDRTGRDSLHSLLRSIAAGGSAVLFVSHDIGEVLSLADRVTVLRDGRVVETANSAELDADDIVGLIVGGDRSVRLDDAGEAGAALASEDSDDVLVMDRDRPRKPVGRLTVSGLHGLHVRDLSFEAGQGEIVGITGIVGSGWEFVLEHLYGASPAWRGRLQLDDQGYDIADMTPRKALEQGMVFVPSERLSQGIISELTLEENVMLPVLDRSFLGGRLRLREMSRACKQVLHDHAVHPPQPSRPIGTLSGGNQQKAVLGKWLQLRPRVVLLNEPTQGVDVGARQLIFKLIREAARQGAVVLYASSDWDEVSRLAQQVVVVADGRVAEILSGAAVTVDRIAASAYQGTRRSADLARASDMWSEA